MVDAAHWHFSLSGITQSLLNSKCRFPSLFCPSGRPSATAMSAMFKATQPTAIDRPSCVDCTDGSLMAAATSVTASLASPGDSSCSSAKDAAASFFASGIRTTFAGWLTCLNIPAGNSSSSSSTIPWPRCLTQSTGSHLFFLSLLLSHPFVAKDSKGASNNNWPGGNNIINKAAFSSI